MSVNATNAGEVELTWRYAAKSQRPATLWVNDTPHAIPLVFENTGEWDDWATLSTSVNVVVGENRLTLRADSDDGLPNMDHIEVFAGGISRGIAPLSPSDQGPVNAKIRSESGDGERDHCGGTG